MMDINKTFEAECIDDTIGLTKGKKYVVTQSKEYDKYFVLRNDDEKVDTYRKERFKLLDQINTSKDFGIFAPIFDEILKWCIESNKNEDSEQLEGNIAKTFGDKETDQLRQINYEEEYKKLKDYTKP